ncbi:hypothetical protein [Pontiella sp.]|uniref:hypothetical protein n=1 Tax=Pontiella sp. TaxID=2837462 RepID=UPI0035619CD3
MPNTDIYKQREPLPFGNKPPEKKRRRRSASKRAFDDHSRKRRSKNSGLRRLLHLWRKSSNEKAIWISIGVVFIVLLIVVAVWQFVILEHMVRIEEQKIEGAGARAGIPAQTDAAAPAQ